MALHAVPPQLFAVGALLGSFYAFLKRRASALAAESSPDGFLCGLAVLPVDRCTRTQQALRWALVRTIAPMADGPPIRVLVGDASRMTSQLIAGQLKTSRSPRFETLLPVCFTSKAIADEIIRTQPDVALVSSLLQDSSFSGYSVLRTIQPLNLATRSILFLEDCEHDPVIDAFRSGARGVFSRAESSELLSKCIYSVHRGQIWASTREMEYMLAELVATRPLRIVDANGRSLLSKREEEVVALVVDGLTNRQISEELKLSEHTVKNYLFKVFEKLGISTRVELVLYALSNNHRSIPAIDPVRIAQQTRRQSTTLPLVTRRIGI